jgi:hypothetical protein
LVEHPQIDGTQWPMLKDSERSLRQQMSTDPLTLGIASDVEIVEKGSPLRIIIENDMGEAQELPVAFCDDGVMVLSGRSKATSPYLLPIGDDVLVKVCVPQRTAIMAPPTVGVKCGDAAGILFRRFSISHDSSKPLVVVRGHGSLLIDPGIGTAPRPAAGPSKGQVPQVALDEQISGYRAAIPCLEGEAKTHRGGLLGLNASSVRGDIQSLRG